MIAKDERPAGRSEPGNATRDGRPPKRPRREPDVPIVFRIRDLSEIREEQQTRRPWWVR